MAEYLPMWSGDDFSDAEFGAITELLRRLRQFDLEQYKDRCIRRRIAKRLRCCRVANVDAYLQRLQTDQDELDKLLATISIHVSHFFRNLDTFRVLELKILPELCRRARVSGRNRLTLWSAGCASGEEAYSLALLVDDLAASDLDIRILATDISQPVLDTAQIGVFDAVRLKEVPQAVIDKYFLEMEGRYQIIEGIRSKVEFLRHDMIAAEDYPAADLILCRNVLIYFTRSEQERILTRFAKALPEHGVLVLGRSESITGNTRAYFQSEIPLERVYLRTAETIVGPAA
ncbi:MAG: CheR family methyltransferase [Desulfuromonadales bacterium]